MLIHCTCYQNGRPRGELAISEIGHAMQTPDSFVWVALHDPTPQELAPLQEVFDLHPLAVEDVLQGQQRPKMEEYGMDSVFMALHLLSVGAADAGDHAKDGVSPKLQVGQLAVFAGPRYVVSVRSRSSISLAAVRERCEREPELLRQGPGFVLYALIDEVVDRYFPISDRIEDELEAIEKRIFTQRAGVEVVQRVYALKRRLRVMRHAVVPLMDAVARLHATRVPPLCGPVQHYFRDVFDHVSRLSTSIDGTRDSLDTTIQVHLALVTIDDGDVTKRLAAWAAIFGVCTSMVGVWGMNFDVMPELHWRWGYPAALGTILAVCGLLYLRLRRAGWL